MFIQDNPSVLNTAIMGVLCPSVKSFIVLYNYHLLLEKQCELKEKEKFTSLLLIITLYLIK